MVAGMKSLFQKPKWRTWLFVLFVLGFYVTRTRLPDPINNVVLDGRYGFMAVGKSGVIVLDFYSKSDNSAELLTKPVQMAEFDTLGVAHSLEIDDELVYVANDNQGLLVLSKERILGEEQSGEGQSENEGIIENIFQTPGKALDVALRNKHVYLIDDKEEIIIIEKNKLGEDNPPYNNFDVPGKPELIKIFKNQLFVANDEGQLIRYTLSEPDNLEEGITFNIGSQINNFVLNGKYLYIATESGGFQIRENNSQPEEDPVGEFRDINTFYDVSLKGNYAFGAAGKEGLIIFSVKDPSTIVKIGQDKKPNAANLTFWIDDFIYVADGTYGLKTFANQVDFKYAEQKKTIQHGQYNDVLVNDDIAYIAAGDFGLQVINVNNPSIPRNKYFTDIKIDADNKDSATALAISGEEIYVAYRNDGLRVFDISDNKENPEKIDKHFSTSGKANDVVIQDKIAYVAVGSAGLQIFDLDSDNDNGYIEKIPGDAQGVFVRDDYAYIAAENRGLHIVQVSDFTKPTLKNTIDTPGEAKAVYVVEIDDANGEKKLYAFVADGEEGLFIADVTDPNNPLSVSSFKTGAGANDLVVRGKTVYISDKSDGLVTINIDNLSEPRRLGNKSTPGNALGLFLLGNLNYVADGDRGLRIIDTEDKNLPVEVGFYDIPTSVYKILTDGSYAYLVDGTFGLWILSLEDRNAPYPVAFYLTPGQALDIAIEDKFAFIADGDKGVRIVSIEDPKNPKFVGLYDQIGKAISIAVDGNTLYVGTDQNKMFILNAEDKTLVEELKTYDTQGKPFQIAFNEGYTYISEGGKGLEIVFVENPDDLDSYLANENHGLTDTRSVEVLPSGNLVRMDGHKVQGAQDNIIVSDGKNGMKVFNVHRPFKPNLIFEFPLEEDGEAIGASAVEEYAFLSAGEQGLFTFYIWDLNKITLVGRESSLPQTRAIAALSSVDKKSKNAENGIGDNRYHNYVFTADEALYTYQVNGQSQINYKDEYELIGEATVIQIIQQLLNALLHRDPSLVQAKVITRIKYIAFGVFVLVSVSLFWLFLLSRFVLPIRTIKDWRKSFSQLWVSLWGSHGPAVLVKGGHLISKPSELQRRGRGVARLDFNSAVVLERRAMFHPGWRRNYEKMKKRALKKGSKLKRAHVEGPGVVFIQPIESLRGVADLRTQFRIRPGVQAYTRDGIEVDSPVWILFTLGQPPEILDVTYDGAREAKNLRVINFDDDATITLENSEKRRGLLVKGLVDELDESDKTEIHLFVQERIIGKFLDKIKKLSSDIDLNNDPENIIEEYVDRIKLLISRFKIDDRKRVDEFLSEVSKIADQLKQNGNIDIATYQWFDYRVSVLADFYATEGMIVFHETVYSIKKKQYLQEIQNMDFPKDLVEYAQQRMEQFFKQQKGDDENREFILLAFRIKFIIDREINRIVETLSDTKVDEVRKEKLTHFQEKIDTITFELIRTNYPFTNYYAPIAKLYGCVQEMNQIATQITISDEWRFPNMKDLFKIRNIVRDIQENFREQEKACEKEIYRYLDLVIVDDFVALTHQQFECLRLSKTSDEKIENSSTCVELIQNKAKSLDRVTDPGIQKYIKTIKESLNELDKNNSSDVFFFLKQVDNLWQKIKSADILVVESFLRKSQKQFTRVQKNIAQFKTFLSSEELKGEVQQYQGDIEKIKNCLVSCKLPTPPLFATRPKPTNIGPYLFDPKRVIAAVYSEAQDQDRVEGEAEQMHWTNLPVHVAAQLFRDLVSKEQYNYLYQPNDPDKFNLPKLKGNLRRAVRNQGVLAFRFVDHVDGLPLKSDDELEPEKLVYYKSREL